MSNGFKKSYRFALGTAFYLSLFLVLLAGLYQYFFGQINLISLLVFGAAGFVFCFFIVQYRIEHFIYRQVKSVYDKVSLLDSVSLPRSPVTTDMETLTKEVEKFAEDRKLEIEGLKIREDYRKEFMGNVAHELKTPLFTVQGYILTLLDGAHKDKKIRKKYLNRASKGVERLVYIVQDLDMITKLETGNLNLHKENFDVTGIVKNAFDLLEMKAEKKHITLSFDTDYLDPVMAFGDKERIQQVITNLIVNSIKYGKKDGTTEVCIENLTRNKLIVRVTDNGEGIKKENIPRLFERFFRIDKSGSRKEGGSGLGLSIVKHILEAHGEKLYVESEYGVGSEFSFTVEKMRGRQSEGGTKRGGGQARGRPSEGRPRGKTSNERVGIFFMIS